MAQPFEHTIRALRQDRAGGILMSLGAGLLLLAGWLVWLTVPDLPVRVVIDRFSLNPDPRMSYTERRDSGGIRQQAVPVYQVTAQIPDPDMQAVFRSDQKAVLILTAPDNQPVRFIGSVDPVQSFPDQLQLSFPTGHLLSGYSLSGSRLEIETGQETPLSRLVASLGGDKPASRPVTMLPGAGR